MEEIVRRESESDSLPPVRHVPTGQPLSWIARGWTDMLRAPAASLGYGFLITAAGWAVLGFSWNRAYLVTALVSGFFLFAPFLAMGVYDISRRLGRGERATFSETVDAWRPNAGSIALFGLALAFALLSWERVSAIIFALSHGDDAPMVENFFAQVFLSGEYVGFVVSYIVAGAVIAAVVFSISVVSIPMMLDRPVDPVTAIITSLRAVGGSKGAMLLWAVTIVVLTAIGFATALLGLIVIVPLLGHATWHAYKDLVE
ncbi:MAG TPA: DUF2189 domain-containing protein [Burkholderiales bacterium]|nr:DUF2189 domain-containing protein [Burkholderiales bacterium]